jgi:hypothetical protein
MQEEARVNNAVNFKGGPDQAPFFQSYPAPQAHTVNSPEELEELKSWKKIP